MLVKLSARGVIELEKYIIHREIEYTKTKKQISQSQINEAHLIFTN
jgi:hypothetical protein